MKLQMLIFLGAYILGILLSLIVLPYLKKLKVGQVVREDGPKSHLKKAGTPTMGGIVILIASLIVLSIAALKYPKLIMGIIPFIGFGIVGFIDDYKKLKYENTDGLSPMKKIILLFIISAIFILLYIFTFDYGMDTMLPFIHKDIIMPVGIFVIFTIFILLGTSNAINLTDGLDGLATGIVIIIIAFFTAVAIKNNDTEMAIFGTAVMGSSLAFLIFNMHPAKMFLGDTGSLALGGAVAAMAILMKMPIYLAIVALVPVVETLSVALQVIYFKVTKGKRLFKMAPIHHHLELSGLKETKVVTLFWIITSILCVLAYVI